MSQLSETQWASPVSAVLYTAGILAILIFVSLSGIVSPQRAPILGTWLMCGSIVMLIAGVIDFRKGDVFGGTLDTLFGVFLGLAPGVSNIVQFWAMTTNVQLDMRVNGIGLLMSRIVFLLVFFPSCRLVPWLLSLGILDLGIGLIVIGLAFSGVLAMPMVAIGGIIFLIFAAIAIYRAIIKSCVRHKKRRIL